MPLCPICKRGGSTQEIKAHLVKEHDWPDRKTVRGPDIVITGSGRKIPLTKP